ncbi:MAG: fumarylacetoacetate hydrolase family protein [Candidatus Binatia bacterium]
MKLATLRTGGRDGTLVVVDERLERAVAVPQIARTLQSALDDWPAVEAPLQRVAERLNAGRADGEVFTFDVAEAAAPLPRAYQWADGSAYLSHVERVRRARGAEMPPSFRSDPLMYQGVSDSFLGPRDPIPLGDPKWGVDLEAEIAVVVGDVPMGTPAAEAAAFIRLFVLVNDVTFRNLVPDEMAKGFGFFHSKPASALSPVAATPDQLGDAWDGARLHLELRSWINGDLLGRPNAGVDMQFSFPDLIAHAARTRRLAAGSIIGSGTVSNADDSVGVSCLAERRVLEVLADGSSRTPFLRAGDRVRIEMVDGAGRSVFGAIEQEVVA